MKKLFAILFVLAAIFMITGCNEKTNDEVNEDVDQKEPLEVFLNEMETKQNYKMDIKMTMPVFGELNMTCIQDGKKTYTSSVFFSGETYTEEVDGKTYQYMKNEEDQWEKTEIFDDVDVDNEFETIDQILFEDFTKTAENVYTLKAEKLASYEVSSFVIELTTTGAVLKVSEQAEGMTINMEMTISGIGTQTITLPTIQ